MLYMRDVRQENIVLLLLRHVPLLLLLLLVLSGSQRLMDHIRYRPSEDAKADKRGKEIVAKEGEQADRDRKETGRKRYDIVTEICGTGDAKKKDVVKKPVWYRVKTKMIKTETASKRMRAVSGISIWRYTSPSSASVLKFLKWGEDPRHPYPQNIWGSVPGHGSPHPRPHPHPARGQDGERGD